MLKGKEFIKANRKKAIALTCLTGMLFANAGSITAQANVFGDIGGWVSDRAEDVSGIASNAGQAIADSDAGKLIGC